MFGCFFVPELPKRTVVSTFRLFEKNFFMFIGYISLGFYVNQSDIKFMRNKTYILIVLIIFGTLKSPVTQTTQQSSS